MARGLPSIPLVPVSSSQAVIGAVIGIAVAKGGRGVRYSVLGRVAGGWAATPVFAALLAFLGLFFLQNVFGLTVARPVPYRLSETVLERLSEEGVASMSLEELMGSRFENAREMDKALRDQTDLDEADIATTMKYAERDSFVVTPESLEGFETALLTDGQAAALRSLSWKSFSHKWQLRERLAEETVDWRLLPEERENRDHNQSIRFRLRHVYDTFRVPLTE
jgi:PiT family inorganic phosphate transporter